MVMRQVQGRCLSLHGLMNPNQSLRLLPEGQTVVEGSKLAIEVCTVAHMPSDWPRVRLCWRTLKGASLVRLSWGTLLCFRQRWRSHARDAQTAAELDIGAAVLEAGKCL